MEGAGSCKKVFISGTGILLVTVTVLDSEVGTLVSGAFLAEKTSMKGRLDDDLFTGAENSGG